MIIGQQLLHYRIETQLGVGGMGEVYQALDTKLGRSVAVKVLPENLALDPERISRFQREAKLLASLNHENIAALYGLEQEGGRHFLVMELVEGQTLAERIAGGPIPVQEAVRNDHGPVDVRRRDGHRRDCRGPEAGWVRWGFVLAAGGWERNC
jgi:serine/threonine protein kinase